MATQMRKDAARSRRAILDAARELYRDDSEASFAEIAAQAGVGQATIYRHYADRRELLAELAEEGMERLERRIEAEPIEPDSLEALLRELVAEQILAQGVIGAMRTGEIEEDRVEGLALRTRTLLAPRLEAARKASLVRDDIDLDDLMIVLAMFDGVLGSRPDRRGREEAAEQAYRIVLDGLRSKA